MWKYLISCHIDIHPLFKFSNCLTFYTYLNWAWYFWLVYDRNHYFGLGPIPKPKLANTFGKYHYKYQNHISKEKSSYCYRWKSLRSTNPGTPKVRLYISNYFELPLIGYLSISTANKRAVQNNNYTEPDFGVTGFVFIKLCYLYVVWGILFITKGLLKTNLLPSVKDF